MNVSESIEKYLQQDNFKLSLEVRKSFVEEALTLLKYQDLWKEKIDVNELLHLWNSIPPFNFDYKAGCSLEQEMGERREDISAYQGIRFQIIKTNYLPDEDDLPFQKLYPDLAESRFSALGITTPERLKSTGYSIKFVEEHLEEFLKMIHAALKVLVKLQQHGDVNIESIRLAPAASTCSRIGNGLEALLNHLLAGLSDKLPEAMKQDGKMLVDKLFQDNLKVHTFGGIGFRTSCSTGSDSIVDEVYLRPWGMTSLLLADSHIPTLVPTGHILRLRRPWQSPLIKDWLYYSGKELTRDFNSRTTQLLPVQHYAGVALQMLAFALSAVVLTMPVGRGKSRPCWVETPLTVPILSAALQDYIGLGKELLAYCDEAKD